METYPFETCLKISNLKQISNLSPCLQTKQINNKSGLFFVNWSILQLNWPWSTNYIVHLFLNWLQNKLSEEIWLILWYTEVQEGYKTCIMDNSIPSYSEETPIISQRTKKNAMSGLVFFDTHQKLWQASVLIKVFILQPFYLDKTLNEIWNLKYHFQSWKEKKR